MTGLLGPTPVALLKAESTDCKILKVVRIDQYLISKDISCSFGCFPISRVQALCFSVHLQDVIFYWLKPIMAGGLTSHPWMGPLLNTVQQAQGSSGSYSVLAAKAREELQPSDPDQRLRVVSRGWRKAGYTSPKPHPCLSAQCHCGSACRDETPQQYLNPHAWYQLTAALQQSEDPQAKWTILYQTVGHFKCKFPPMGRGDSC